MIQRHLDLTKSYELIKKNYVPILDGGGCICSDCGRLIANIATVKSSVGVFDVGFDCLEKVLINNTIIADYDIKDLKTYKKQISKIIRFSKELIEVIKNNPNITGIRFEPQTYESDWYTFYWLQNDKKTSNFNDCKKIKGIDYKTLIQVLKEILDIDIYS